MQWKLPKINTCIKVIQIRFWNTRGDKASTGHFMSTNEASRTGNGLYLFELRAHELPWECLTTQAVGKIGMLLSTNCSKVLSLVSFIQEGTRHATKKMNINTKPVDNIYIVYSNMCCCNGEINLMGVTSHLWFDLKPTQEICPTPYAALVTKNMRPEIPGS